MISSPQPGQSAAARRVLMVAFHFPPLSGSSGVLRALKNAQYLPEFGWTPIVLTSHPRAYTQTSDDQMADVPEGIVVKRAFALDASRHLAVWGRYPSWLEIPDRWSPWLFGAVPSGLALIRRFRPDVIWSTFPIATAHLIGLTLHKLTGLPWVADFRDPMAQEGYPADPRRHRAYRWIEEQALKHAARALFTTPGTLRMYAQRYPLIPSERFALNENGYDEESFSAAEFPRSAPTVEKRRLKILHSGIVYPSERDPTQLFAALSQLMHDGAICADDLEVVLRATGHDRHLSALIQSFGIASIVTLAPAIGYREALSEMLQADALLVLQASNCNEQIPAKLYEYFRARRPILALTDPSGDTAKALQGAGIDALAPLDSRTEIAKQLVSFLELLRAGRAPVANETSIMRSSRHARTEELTAQLTIACEPSH